LTKEISDLRSKEAAEIKREAEATRKMNAAHQSASRTSSASMVSSYLSTASREAKNIEAAQGKRAQHSAEIARKTQEVGRIQDRVMKAEEVERKAAATADAKRRKDDERARRDLTAANVQLRRDYEARVSNLEAQLAAQIEAQASDTPPFALMTPEGEQQPYDFFISHAWADKAEFVDAFVEKAKAAGLRVWYDRFALQWGDPIRQKIDEGLRSSYFGVVVLSPNFFERPWPNYELDGILQRDLSGRGRLLPIWHRLTQDDVEEHAPSLVGRLALSTASSTTDAIVKELIIIRDRFKEAMDKLSED
jgi:hypothetical protein